MSVGYNRRIVKDWEISAIFDAFFGARATDIGGATLFSTYLPDVDELKLIVATGVSTIYFFGNIDKPESARFMNELNQSSISLEIINLKE